MELNTAVDLVEDAQTLLFYIEAGASGKSVSSNVVEYVKMDAPKLELEEETASKSRVNLKWTSSTSSNKQVEYTLMCVKDQTTQPSSVPQKLKVTTDLKTVADNLEAGHIYSFYVEATLKERGCVTVKEAVRSNNVEYNFVKPVEEGISAPVLEEVPEEDIPTSRFPAKKKVSDIFDDPFKAEEVEEAPKPKRKSLKEKQAEAAKLKAEEDAAKLEAKKIKEGAAEKAKLLAEKKKKDAEEAKRLEEEKKKAQEKKAEEARRAREEAEKQEEEETEEEPIAPVGEPVVESVPTAQVEKPALQPVDLFGDAEEEEQPKKRGLKANLQSKNQDAPKPEDEKKPPKSPKHVHFKEELEEQKIFEPDSTIGSELAPESAPDVVDAKLVEEVAAPTTEKPQLKPVDDLFGDAPAEEVEAPKKRDLKSRLKKPEAEEAAPAAPSNDKDSLKARLEAKKKAAEEAKLKAREEKLAEQKAKTAAIAAKQKEEEEKVNLKHVEPAEKQKETDDKDKVDLKHVEPAEKDQEKSQLEKVPLKKVDVADLFREPEPEPEVKGLRKGLKKQQPVEEEPKTKVNADAEALKARLAGMKKTPEEPKKAEVEAKPITPRAETDVGAGILADLEAQGAANEEALRVQQEEMVEKQKPQEKKPMVEEEAVDFKDMKKNMKAVDVAALFGAPEEPDDKEELKKQRRGLLKKAIEPKEEEPKVKLTADQEAMAKRMEALKNKKTKEPEKKEKDEKKDEFAAYRKGLQKSGDKPEEKEEKPVEETEAQKLARKQKEEKQKRDQEAAQKMQEAIKDTPGRDEIDAKKPLESVNFDALAESDRKMEEELKKQKEEQEKKKQEAEAKRKGSVQFAPTDGDEAPVDLKNLKKGMKKDG